MGGQKKRKNPTREMGGDEYERLAYAHHRAKAQAYGNAGMYDKARSHARAAKAHRAGVSRGGEMRRIRSLLGVGSGTKQIKVLKEAMATYIASPWDAIDRAIMSAASYDDVRRRAEADGVELGGLCAARLDASDAAHGYQKRLCQSHAGDLLEHSQWSALQILKWHVDGDQVMDGVGLETAIVSAFFHDIGKGGDCVDTCLGGTCWRDMYSSKKYDGKGESEHPVRSGDMILGKTPFVVNCGECAKNCTINVRTLIERTFRTVPVAHVALAAYMHWEFGKLNMPGASDADKRDAYFRAFDQACGRCGLSPDGDAGLALLRLCIAVACADIAAGTNRRLLPNVAGVSPAAERYMGNDPWTFFSMEKNYLIYRTMLLDAHQSRRR